jgi:hypothetical protein
MRSELTVLYRRSLLSHSVEADTSLFSVLIFSLTMSVSSQRCLPVSVCSFQMHSNCGERTKDAHEQELSFDDETTK